MEDVGLDGNGSESESSIEQGEIDPLHGGIALSCCSDPTKVQLPFVAATPLKELGDHRGYVSLKQERDTNVEPGTALRRLGFISKDPDHVSTRASGQKSGVAHDLRASVAMKGDARALP